MELLLIPTALLTSTLSGVLGMGGGILLLAVMAEFYPPVILIPLHGIIQWFSNISRVGFHIKSVNWKIVGPYCLGAVLGALLGRNLVIELPELEFKIIIALFILLATWLPKFKSAPKLRGKFFFLGTGATFLSLFVGATGPLTAPFYLRENLERHTLVATKAMNQTLMHTFKVIVYFTLGFVLQEHIVILVGMVIAAILGSYIGKKVLNKVSEGVFQKLYRITLTLLALRMLLGAAYDLASRS